MLSIIIVSLIVKLSVAEVIQCLYYQAKVRLNKGNRTHVDGVMHLCRIEGINYALPETIFSRLEEMDIQSGVTTLQVQGLKPNQTNSKFDLISSHDRPTLRILSQNRNLKFLQRTTGKQSILVVRVVSKKDSETLEPSLSRSQLRNQIFGDPSSPTRISLKSQYAMCSEDNLNFIPASYDGNDFGVFNLIVDRSLKNKDFSLHMENIVAKAFEDKFDNEVNYDYAMLCLPKGMNGEFVAFAIVNNKFSFFSDPWCGSLSGTMHEIGHNMGMEHSGQFGENEYDDETCIMGIGYQSATGPQKCFNGQKLWAFNWFPKNKEVVDPIADGEWRGKLTAFVDVTLTQGPVVLRVGDLYLVYNRSKKYNSQVNEMADMVTIVKAPTSTSKSTLQAGIDGSPGRSTFSILSKFPDGTHGITIEVCHLIKDSTIDYADLSIRKDGTPSSCGISMTPPRPINSPIVTCNSDTDCRGVKGNCMLTPKGKTCRESKNANTSTRAPRRPKITKTPTVRKATKGPIRRKFSMVPTPRKLSKVPTRRKFSMVPTRKKMTSAPIKSKLTMSPTKGKLAKPPAKRVHFNLDM